MKKLFAVLVLLVLLPFMAVGALFEIAVFGFDCGRGAMQEFMEYAFGANTMGELKADARKGRA